MMPIVNALLSSMSKISYLRYIDNLKLNLTQNVFGFFVFFLDTYVHQNYLYCFNILQNSVDYLNFFRGITSFSCINQSQPLVY